MTARRTGPTDTGPRPAALPISRAPHRRTAQPTTAKEPQP